MRWLIHILLLGLTITSSALYAFDPKSGWYSGLIVGANYAANVPFTYPFVENQGDPVIEYSGQLGHKMMGSIGGQLGYRWCDNFRFELEAIYNDSTYSYLRFHDVTFHSPKTTAGFRINGKTQSGVATFNAFYDLFGNYSSKAVPYIGGGLGFASIKNNINFYENDVLLGNTAKSELLETYGITLNGNSRSGFVGQAIVGLSYYLDDYCYFALDARYLASKTQSLSISRTNTTVNQFDKRYKLYTVNIVFNSAFDCA
ncbi:MAG: outer membrane beta-barrel protein [Legionella sp.]|nr:outer membrane beta-barrel protein [Legionella sp.]